jgi:uncharacterized membrane protein YgdD (TMEM256/DUF423 family)
MNINKTFIQIAAFDAILTIALGTICAHILKTRFSAAEQELFQTGLRYQFYHLFAIALVGVIYYNAKEKMIKWAGILFIAGTILFCGSVYIFAFALSRANMGLAEIQNVAPYGGFCFLAGWLLVILSLTKKR